MKKSIKEMTKEEYNEMNEFPDDCPYDEFMDIVEYVCNQYLLFFTKKEMDYLTSHNYDTSFISNDN